MSGADRQHVRDIEYYLRHISWIVKKRGREMLQDFDITPPQFYALLILAIHGNLTMGELCRHLYLASSTVTDLIDRMEKSGLVARERDSEDRRVIRIRVLDKGHELMDVVMEARLEYLSSVLQGMDREQRDNLAEALKSLYQVMTQETADTTTG